MGSYEKSTKTALLICAARANPDSHPGIVVRVAGYCAYFNDLQPMVKDEVICRPSHGVE
ncbi:MAG: hypothetical protein JEZ02_08885 [Desulfatibacillum sp.]|nr:hypothetical protein [Desulfatibacillum sp.]